MEAYFFFSKIPIERRDFNKTCFNSFILLGYVIGRFLILFTYICQQTYCLETVYKIEILNSTSNHVINSIVYLL